MIRVLSGPANSGKTQTLIARVADAVAAGQPGAHLIAPSTSAVGVLRELLSDAVGNLFLKNRHPVVTTFRDFYYAILDKANAGLRRLNLIERDRVLRFVIAELAQSGRLGYFGATAAMPGLVNALGALIEELWRGGLTPAAFTRIAEKRGGKDRDIARVFAEYAAVLAALDAVDAESAGHHARALIEQANEPRRWFSLIAVDGFDFLTATQVGLLATLAARGVNVLVGLTYDEARAIHYWQRPTVARLRAAGADFIQCAAEPKGRIQVAAAALMTEAAASEAVINASSEDGEVMIISAPDRAAEVRAAAREIKRLAVAHHIALTDITIVCRTLSFYAHHIERIFGECAIPVTLDTMLAVPENPAVVALLRLFGLSSQTFSRRACLEAWRSPYFDWSEFGLDEKAIDLLDAMSLAGNVVGGRAQWQNAVTRFTEKRGREQIGAEYDADEDQNEAERDARYHLLAANLDRCLDALAPLARATREAHFAWASRLIERLRVDEKAASGETGPRDGRALKEFQKILAALTHDGLTRRLVGERADSAGDEITWQAFVGEVERTLAGLTYDRDPAPRSAVVVQEAHRPHPRRYRAVFVLGLIEGEFPGRLTERAPYTQAEREALRQAGVDWTETSDDAGADLLSFSKAMSRALERLYLTYARTDVAGGELLPSYLIEEVQPLVASPVRRIGSAAAGEARHLSDACSLEELAISAAQANRQLESTGIAVESPAGLAAERLLDSRLPSWQMTRRGAQAERRRLYGTLQDNHKGWIGDRELGEGLRRRFGPEHLWSASQINDYGRCPFRFFARHVLKLDSNEEPEEGFAAHHLGHAYHRILEDLYTQLRRRGDALQSHSAAGAIEEALRITEAVLQKMLDADEVRRDGLWEFNKDEIKRRIGRLLRREAQWNDELRARPVHCERKFGLEGAAPLIIPCDSGEARVCGIVDRIDQRDNGEWVVVDYKTRRTPIPVKDAVDGRNLQLPIYAMAATRVINKQASLASAYYLHIHSRKRGSQLSNEGDAAASLETLIRHAEARIRHYVEQIRGGSFPVQPNGNSVCQACEYEVMCRIQSLRASEDEQDRDD